MTNLCLPATACILLIVDLTTCMMVYPAIIEHRGNGQSGRKLVITPNHILRMDEVSLLSDTYTERIKVNGTTMDVMLDSRPLQENMYECPESLATYSISFFSGDMHVEGIVNSTHAIRPMKRTRRWSGRVPHKLFRISPLAHDTSSKRANGVDSNEAGTVLIEDQRIKDSHSSRRKPQERSFLGSDDDVIRNKPFEIEVHCVIDSVLGQVYSFSRMLARYVCILVNVVNLKIKRLKKHTMSVRLVGIRYNTEKTEDEKVLVLKEEEVDISATLQKFGSHVENDPFLDQADMVILLTGRATSTWRTGKKEELSGLAYQGAVCKDRMKVAVVKDIGGAYMGSNNMAHEMGHLLGSPHDGPDNWRFPDCAEDGGIMSPNLEAKAAHSFSTCSEDSIANFLERMSDYEYEKCIAVKQPNKDFLSVQMHIVPPTLTAEEYCEATQGSLHYYSDFAGCIITCYHGGFWSGWPRQVYPAPYGMRCGEGMMCLYGECVSCDQYTPSWYDC